ncbi:type II toxin-antitoxin system antitoxin TsaA [Staphylococcus simiae]|uniref:Uncharacterized protein n=1 Tax=Staphylococcus simiae CCM 7213 = CCUG 51256 TaxID=911238 RepID=G5JIR6_9STAP|nr:hypothetical protein [Staphylococcus simiae]EHJ07919.1 hypothetical protein SS7213T_06771 [Staphylococcus simiae CCM 7213 = CCUG 51256]PNZ09697.1 hypothetical protein CD113_11545 [Staphylococcus simiae]SNV65334.1 membrane protein [Staphylococcus simiae]
MKISKLSSINLILTIIFALFNVVITYNQHWDNNLWLLPGIIICSIVLITTFIVAMIAKDLLSELLFLINIVLTLYYIYPIFYDLIN